MRRPGERLVIVGAGGLGREVAQWVLEMGSGDVQLSIRGFLDDGGPTNGSTLRAPLLGSVSDYEIQPDDVFFLAIGDPHARSTVADSLSARGARFHTVIHPLANVARTADIGPGSLVGPFSTVANDCVVEPQVLLLPYALAGHDCTIGTFSVLSPRSVVNGESGIGEGVFLGTMACVNPRLKIGAWAKLAAGCFVYDNIPDGSLVEGNPAVAHPMEFHLHHS